MRRQDIMEVLGHVPTPPLEVGKYLVDALFSVGPVGKEEPVTWPVLESWSRQQGIDLRPWQCDVILGLSKEYYAEMCMARNWNALAPWPPARNMWKYVKDQQNGARLAETLDTPIKGHPGNGNRKRHRNPPTG